MKALRVLRSGLLTATLTLVISVGTNFGFTQSADAAPITIPVGLNPGDTYRLVFVDAYGASTSSTDINDYNSVVEAIGFAATGITGWRAIVSTMTVNAIDNTNTAGPGGAPIYLLDGTTKIADNNADLWDGSIDAPINVNASNTGGATQSYTGTLSDGTASANPLGSVLVSLGSGTALTTSDWIDDGSTFAGGTFTLFAISGELTVPVAMPEPASMVIFAFGLAGIGLLRFKKTA